MGHYDSAYEAEAEQARKVIVKDIKDTIDTLDISDLHIIRAVVVDIDSIRDTKRLIKRLLEAI